MSAEFVDLDVLSQRVAAGLRRNVFDPRHLIGVPPGDLQALVRAARMLVDIFEAQPPALRQIDLDHVAVVVAPFRGPPVEA